MAYGSVHVPAGCTFKIGDTVGGLATLGVLKGDSTIEITYDLIEALGSKAEELISYAKNMRAVANCVLYQLHLPNFDKIMGGLTVTTPQAGVIVDDHVQLVPSGTWKWNVFIQANKQNGDKSLLQIDATGVPTVSGSVDGALVADTDFSMVQDEEGEWGIIIMDSATVTTEAQELTYTYDYTPNASNTLVMGSPVGTMTAKIVEFSKTIAAKVFRARLWSAKNEAGMVLAFPDSINDEPASMPVALSGRLDAGKADGAQLIEIYDEIGLTV